MKYNISTTNNKEKEIMKQNKYKCLIEFVELNPKEKLPKNTIAKKISMNKLLPFTKQIQGFSFEKYKGGTKFRNGDTLLSRITPCLENGKTAQVTILDEDEIGFGSTEFIVLRAVPNTSDKDYIYYLSLSNDFRNIAIKSMVGTSGRQRVQQSVLEQSNFFAPNLSTQKKIASILSALDDKIELNNKINENLLQIGSLIFKKYYELGKLETLESIINIIESGSREKGGAIVRGIPSIGAEKIERFGIYDYSKEKFISKKYFNNPELQG